MGVINSFSPQWPGDKGRTGKSGGKVLLEIKKTTTGVLKARVPDFLLPK